MNGEMPLCYGGAVQAMGEVVPQFGVAELAAPVFLSDAGNRKFTRCLRERDTHL